MGSFTSTTAGKGSSIYFRGADSIQHNAYIGQENSDGSVDIMTNAKPYAAVFTSGFSAPLQLGTNDTSRLMIAPSTGFVGIGTGSATPSTMLEVAGTVSANEFGAGWTAFTPTMNAGTTLNTSLIGRYRVIGKTCYVQVKGIDSASGVSNATAITVGGLPLLVKSTNALYVLGSGVMKSNTTTIPIVVYYNSAGNLVELDKDMGYINCTNADMSAGLRGFGITFSYEIN